MELTQTVVNAQNSERRKFVEHVKLGMSHQLGVKKSWQQLIQQLSHERLVPPFCMTFCEVLPLVLLVGCNEYHQPVTTQRLNSYPTSPPQI